METDIKGKIRNTRLPKTQTLLPLFEAIVNSIDAIEELGKNHKGQITINVEKDTSQLKLDGTIDDYPVKTFHILDNGSGFNEMNMDSFTKSDTTHKSGKGGKGVGRFVWLKAFKKVKIESTYKEPNDNAFYSRTFDFTDEGNGLANDELIKSDKEEYKTKISLINLRNDYIEKCPKSIEEIGLKIIQHCLVFFLEKNCPIIRLKDNVNEIILNNLFETNFKAGFINGKIPLKEQNFSYKILKIFNQPNALNKIHYCAHKREVKAYDLNKIIPDLKSKFKDEPSGKSYNYSCYVFGKYLDEIVNNERTGFNFPDYTDSIEFPNEVYFEDLQEQLVLEIKVALENELKEVREQKLEKVTQFINNKAPQFRPILKYKPEELEAIAPNLSESKLNIELYRIHSKIDIELKEASEKFLKKDVENETDFEEFKNSFQFLYNELNDISKSKLANYIIDRKLVLKFFEKCLKLGADEKYSLEESVHKIIFPLKKESSDISFEDQNLWLIDEKLSYHKYLSSDIALNKIEELNIASGERPDILIFNTPFAFVNEDKPYQSIAIVEFKRPGRKDYGDEKENPINQVINYIIDIKEGDRLDKEGRPFQVDPKTPFYAYIICDLTKKLQKLAKMDDFILSPDGMGYYKYHKELNALIEIISFDKLLKDAKSRNRILFDKLNLTLD